VGRLRPRSAHGRLQAKPATMFFSAILVTHPKSYTDREEEEVGQRRRIAAISAANRQNGGEDGCYREKSRNYIAWAEPDPKLHFSRFKVPFDYPAHSLHETVLPQTNGKAETLKVCLLLVWRVCNQTFGR